MNEQIWWYLARASGIVAWLLLTATVLWGIFLATDLFHDRRRPAWLLDLHRWFGGLSVCFLVVHLGALMADSYIEFSIADLLVPLNAEWKPVPVALGVVALWLLVAVQLTSYARRYLPKAVWRGVHVSSYAAFWLTSLHSTLAGTDRLQPLYLSTSILCVAAVMFAVLYRILNGRRRRAPTGPKDPVEQSPVPV